jgi:hypothetical protein
MGIEQEAIRKFVTQALEKKRDSFYNRNLLYRSG